MGLLNPAHHRRRPRRLRPLLALRRRPRLRRSLSVAVGLVVAVAVHQVLTGAAEHRERWGRTTPVVVALVDLTAGHRLDGSEVAVRDLPAALVPQGHLRALPVGAVLRHPVRAGEVLVEDRVTSPGRSPLAAVLPEGTRAVAIPVDESTAPPLAPGDLVDVFVSVDPSAVTGPPAFAVAREVLVVDVGEHAVAVAVREDLVARVAFAAASGMVALVLVAAPAAP